MVLEDYFEYGTLTAAGALALYPAGLLLYQWKNAPELKKEDAASNVSDEKEASKPNAAVAGESSKVDYALAVVQALASCLVWLGICALPLAMTMGAPRYRSLFPATWYDEAPVHHALQGPLGTADPWTVKPLGLTLGILAVAVGQAFTVLYHALRRAGYLGTTRRIQSKEERTYNFVEGLTSHLAQPEGFALIGGYLVGSWMLGWMPASYYSFEGGINWGHVAAQLVLQDGFQYVMHYGEHKISAWIYRKSHKPHHRFTNPRLFDAFDGSLTDTTLMIIVPFLIVKRIVHANVWSYMAFGSLYANWLVLIHSEYKHPWDTLFRWLGFGTAADHHVHHKFFVFNYGHLFMHLDRLMGTYRAPEAYAGAHFNKDV
eukprot:TRINITY_DN4910_c0_g1_i1.p1 TRINITY_DN4910_c0_g1~~TRINITY_DN4910_c0_g1_i1.p1  ORF type:complete len:406 (+),score=73.10 TRINITY_DN4910_c0_g1_i1:101-1219(+)